MTPRRNIPWSRWWRRTPVSRLSTTAAFAAGGARVHPAARVEGARDAVALAAGVKVSERVVLAAEQAGRIRVDEDVWFAADCEIRSHTPAGIRIGRGTTVQRGTSLQGTVTIGAGCILAPNVFVSSGSHLYDRWPELPIREQERRAPDAVDRPVVIGDDVWLGVNVVVNPGCTVGRGAVVGANAVVTRDVDPYAVVAGVPARRISDRLAWAPPASLDATAEWAIPYLLSGFVLRYGGRLEAVVDGEARLALAAGSAGEVDVVSEPAGAIDWSVVAHDSWVEVTLSSATRARLISAASR